MSSTNRDLVFNKRNFRKLWEQIRSMANLSGIDIHSLRHTAITNVAKNCRNREELKSFSRHKSELGLKPYLHLIEEKDKRQIAELSSIWEQ